MRAQADSKSWDEECGIALREHALMRCEGLRATAVEGGDGIMRVERGAALTPKGAETLIGEAERYLDRLRYRPGLSTSDLMILEHVLNAAHRRAEFNAADPDHRAAMDRLLAWLRTGA